MGLVWGCHGDIGRSLGCLGDVKGKGLEVSEIPNYAALEACVTDRGVPSLG